MSTIKPALKVTWVVLLVALLAQFAYANLTGFHEARVSGSQYAAPSLTSASTSDPTMLALVIETAYDELARLPGSSGVTIAWDSPVVKDINASGAVQRTNSHRASAVIHLDSGNLQWSTRESTVAFTRYVVRHEFAHILQSRMTVSGMFGGFLPAGTARFLVERDLDGMVGTGLGGPFERAADWYARYMHGQTPVEVVYYTRDDATFHEDVDHDALRTWFERAEGLS